MTLSAFTVSSYADEGSSDDVDWSAYKGTSLTVYNWGEYISDGSEGCLDSNKAFEDWYYKQTGERVKVVYNDSVL